MQMTKIIELKQKDITAISGGVNCTEWQKLAFYSGVGAVLSIGIYILSRVKHQNPLFRRAANTYNVGSTTCSTAKASRFNSFCSDYSTAKTSFVEEF
jgi:hypothetical protein